MDSYIEALDLLSRALIILDQIDERAAAAHLSNVVDMVQSVIAGSEPPR